MNIGRRDILKLALGSAAIGAGWSFAAPGAALAKISNTQIKHAGFRNTLMTLGMHGNRHPDVILGKIPSAQKGSSAYRNTHSFLTEIEIDSGNIKQTVLPITAAHGAMRLPNGTIAVTSHHRKGSVLIDPDHQTIKRFEAPKGYLFGGHGWFLPEQNVALAAVRRANPKTKDDTGLIMVYDADSFKLLDQYDTGGIHPHEIRVLPNAEEFVVTHYGDIDTPHPKGLRFHVIEPKLTVFDLKTFKKKRDYHQPIDAIYTHMDVGAYGDVYAITNQYLPLGDLNRIERREAFKQFDIHHDYQMSPMSRETNRVALPGSVIKVDPQTGERQEFVSSQSDHLRSQSIGAHPGSKRIFATYVHSNKLVMIDEAKKEVSAIDAFKYGCHAIRGVTAIPDSDYIAICDQDLGVAIINAYTLEMVQQFPAKLLRTAHIFAG